MVEENFEIWLPETLQIDLILLLSENITSPRLKKIEIWYLETLQID